MLGVLIYGWVVLPFVKGAAKGGAGGGVSRVRDVWRAKWLNKGPGGEPLP